VDVEDVMPEYKIRIELPHQVPYQLQFNAMNAADCRDKIMKFFRALGIATNVCKSIDEMVARAIVLDHVYTYDVRITTLPPVNDGVQQSSSDDLAMIRHNLKHLFGSIGDGGLTLVSILNGLGRIKTNQAQKLAREEMKRTQLADNHRQQSREWELQRETVQAEKRTIEARLLESERERDRIHKTVTILQQQNESLTAQIRGRDELIASLQPEVDQLRNQVRGLANELHECRNGNPVTSNQNTDL
jgi:hypothetical protein